MIGGAFIMGGIIRVVAVVILDMVGLSHRGFFSRDETGARFLFWYLLNTLKSIHIVIGCEQ